MAKAYKKGQVGEDGVRDKHLLFFVLVTCMPPVKSRKSAKKDTGRYLIISVDAEFCLEGSNVEH
jgi:hypothetical protein